VVAAWRLERLENLGINPWSIPGLTPGLLGVLMVILAGALAWQARRQAADENFGNETAGEETVGDKTVGEKTIVHATIGESDVNADDGRGWGRTFLAGTLCILFAGVALGHGLPFMVEAAAFIFLFVSVFSWSRWRQERRIGRGLLTTLVIAVVASASTSWLFESVFLVRLP
jgi:hypothetical protein